MYRNGSSDRQTHSSVPTHSPQVFWITGLSAAGKTTLAQALASHLYARNTPVAVLDGDELRQGRTPALAT